MYTVKDFPTKKALKAALAAGDTVRVYHPGLGSEKDPVTGTVFLEGPHYPKPHTWYAQATAVDGVLTRVK
jgi:hypothetical protein